MPPASTIARCTSAASQRPHSVRQSAAWRAGADVEPSTSRRLSATCTRRATREYGGEHQVRAVEGSGGQWRATRAARAVDGCGRRWTTFDGGGRRWTACARHRAIIDATSCQLGAAMLTELGHELAQSDRCLQPLHHRGRHQPHACQLLLQALACRRRSRLRSGRGRLGGGLWRGAAAVRHRVNHRRSCRAGGRRIGLRLPASAEDPPKETARRLL